ncbi:MAG: diaminopimelate epimerase [Bacteroidota bacterium]
MRFTKMHGLGNDFIVLDGSELRPETDLPALAVRLCHRQLGVGADGLMIVLPSDRADARMRIINSDGSEAEMCGNGIRCFAKYVFERGLVPRTRMTVETLAGPIGPELSVEDGRVTAVTVDMGHPVFERHLIPMLGPPSPAVSVPLDTGAGTFEITSMLMGVPHTVIFVDRVEEVALDRLGPLVERHSAFPRRTNVNFVEVVNSGEIKVRTWERGAGPTYACGTGSCAAAVAACLTGRTGPAVTVHLRLGDLRVEWVKDRTVYMTGPAEEVFRGEVSLA